MVWGGIMYGNQTPLIFISGTLTAQRHIDLVVEPVVCPRSHFSTGQHQVACCLCYCEQPAWPKCATMACSVSWHVSPSTSRTSLVGNCKGSCQQPILMICVPKCIQCGITFLRQPLRVCAYTWQPGQKISDQIASGNHAEEPRYSVLPYSAQYWINQDVLEKNVFLFFIMCIFSRLFLLGVAISMLRSVVRKATCCKDHVNNVDLKDVKWQASFISL